MKTITWFVLLLSGVVPLTGAAESELVSALTALKEMVQRPTEPSVKEVEPLKLVIEKNAAGLGSDETVIRAAFDLVTTYDKVKGPLWVSGKSFHRGKGGSTPPANDIHWTVFNVMQAIVDHVYTPDNVARRESLLNGFKFGCAAHFPGAVEPPADANAVYRVPVNASYRKLFKHKILGEDLPARRPTGAYVAPGSVVTVTVPAALVGKGYQLRVGAHSWDFSRKPFVSRLDRVSLVYPVNSPTVKVANPLGGGLYLEVPLGAEAGVVELAIRNAVRSPFFSTTPYRPTTLAQWRDTERQRKAPWADFQSEKFLMQVPTSWIAKLDDPVTLLADWDKALDAVTDLMGLPNVWGREVQYSQVDLQNRGSAFFPGYPTCNDRYDPKRDYEGHAKNYLVRGPQFAPDYPFHEMGHGMLFAKYKGDREAAVNLLHVAVLNRKFGVDLDEAFRSSRGSTNKFQTLDHTAVEWMMSLHFVNGEPMASYERQYQLKGHAKFVDIVRLFGWEALHRFWGGIVADEEKGRPSPDGDDDRYTLQLSAAAGADLRPLIEFWGIPMQDKTKPVGVPASPKVYDQLQRYKNLVPKDRQAFREFALQWWGRQPSEKGFTTERDHAARWESYDEKEADRVRQRVQAIINAYFPNGRP